jgi:DNA repair exonuclease SbcCD ATPase subunit
MRISTVTLRDVGRFAQATIELAPGLTVVRGPNEAGKSTLQRAIETALVGSAGGPELRSWAAAAGSRSSVELGFSWEDEERVVHAGTIAREIGGAARLVLDGAAVEGEARIAGELADISGIPSAAFLRSTASVRHHELDDLATDDAAFGARLRESISGSDRDSRSARRRLVAALAALQANGTNPGRLRTADNAVTEAAARLVHAEEGLARLARDRELHVAARERRAEAEASLAERRTMLEKARRAEKLIAQRTVARERYERYREAVIVHDEITDLDGRHPSAIPLPVLRTGVARLRTLGERIAELEMQLSGEVHVDFEVAPEIAWRPLSRIALVLVLVGVAIAAAGFALNQLGVGGLWPLAPIVAAVVAGIGLILAVVGLVRRRRNRMERQLRDVEIDRRLRGRSDMEAELKRCRAEQEAVLGELGAADSASAEADLAAEEAHVAELDSRRTRLVALVADEPREGLDVKRDAAALEIEQHDAALDALGPIAKEPNASQRLEVEVADAEATLDRARNEEADARARVEQSPADADEVAGLAERHAAWAAQLAALRQRERLWSRTLEELDAAEQATVQQATRFLERRMAGDIARITDGRYRRVQISDKDLSVDVFSPERGDWVSVSHLSRGTLDAVYLAARIALVRFATGGRRPPLLLDDPFVTLDAARAARALEVVRDLAADQQVVYLTTSDRYDAVADAVVVLDGPSAVDTGDKETEPVPA